MAGLSDEAILNLMDQIHKRVDQKFQILFEQDIRDRDPYSNTSHEERYARCLRNAINSHHTYWKYLFLKNGQEYVLYRHPGVKERVANDSTILNRIRQQIANAPPEIVQRILAHAASLALSDEDILNLMVQIHKRVGDAFEYEYDRACEDEFGAPSGPDEGNIIRNIVDRDETLKYFFFKKTERFQGFRGPVSRQVYDLLHDVRERVANKPTILKWIRQQIEKAPLEIVQRVIARAASLARAASQAVAANPEEKQNGLYKQYIQ